MKRFRVLHLAADGRLNWQFIAAETMQEAAAQMIGRGLTPLEIRTGNPSLLERLNQPVHLRRRLSRSDLAIMTDQLAALLEAGLPVDRALDLLQSQSSARASRTLLRSAIDRIRAGASLADAFAQHEDIPRFYTGVVRAAERSGRLAGGLRELADALRHAESSRQQAISALTYPFIVLIMTMVALAVVLGGVIPSFESMFEGEEHRLPWLTRAVVGLSRLVTNHGWLLLAGFIAGGLAVWLASRSPRVRRFAGQYSSRLPWAHLYQTYVTGRICRALSTMVANGVPLPEAVVLSGEVTSSRAMKKRLDTVSRRLREGANLSSTLQGEGGFPATAIRLIEVGEQTGRLAELCTKAANLLEADSRVRLERIVGILNPLAVLTLGGLIALLILGVMLGIFSLNEMAM